MGAVTRVVKKIGIVISVLFVLFLVIAIVVPLVVDVDKYRPQIVKIANENINGKLELGKLSLSLWGQVKVNVDGLVLTDRKNRKVVSVKQTFFHLPFTSIFSGSPRLTFKMIKPEVNIVKDKSGKMNVMALVKEEKLEQAEPTKKDETASETPIAPQQEPKATEAKKPVTLPAIATRARLGVELRNALVAYRDEVSGLNTKIKDLNVLLKDISLSRPTQLSVWADLDTKMGQDPAKALKVIGPLRFDATAKPTITDAKLSALELAFKASLDDIEIVMPGVFEKKKGVAANAEGAFKTNDNLAIIEKLQLKFFNAEITTEGQISQFQATSPGQKVSPVVNVTVRSNEIALEPWVQLLPMLKEYQLSGSARFDAAVNGNVDKLNYKAKAGLQKVTAKAPNLKSQPVINAGINVVTDKIDNFFLTLTAPGNDLKVQGKLVSFTAPKLTVDVTSKGMDLDQLIEFPPPKAKVSKKAAADAAKDKKVAANTGAKKDQTPDDSKAESTADYDELIDPLRKNKIAMAAVANINVNMKMLKAYNVKMTEIIAGMTFKDLTAAIDHFSMNLWNGSIKASASAQLKPKTPSYRFSSDVARLDLQQAVTSQLELLKNTVIGKASFKVDGAGSSFNPDKAIVNLNAKGNMKIEKAVFATIDVTKVASEALTKALDKASSKVPPLKGKGIKQIAGRESKYDLIASDFIIADGKFSAPNFVAKSEPNRGIDVQGNTELGLTDYSLKTTWALVDTYNLTGARDIAVEQNGVKVEHVLAEGNNPVKLPVNANCTVMAPCYSYTQVPEYLAKVALSNIAGAVEGKAKAELKRRAEEKANELSKKVPPQVQEKVKGLGKKLFGR